MPRNFEDRTDVSEDFDYDAIDARERPERPMDIEALMKVPEVRSFVGEALKRVLRIIRSGKRARLEADCIVIAIGGELREDGTTASMTEVARDHGITKAAVSKRVATIRSQLHLPTNRNLKSDASRHRYALTNSSPLNLSNRLAVRGSAAPQRARIASRSHS